MESDAVLIDDQQVIDALTLALDAGANPRRLFSAIGRYGVTSTRLRFRNQVDPEGKKWTPAERVRLHGGQTLRLTGRLRNSINFNVLDSGVEWGTNVRYARAHQKGFKGVVRVRSHMRVPKQVTREGKRRIVEMGKPHWVKEHTANMHLERRAFLGFNSDDRVAVLNIATEYFVSATHGAIGG